MKKVLIAAVLLAAILLLAPAAFGRFAEKRADALLDRLVEHAPYVSIVERSWEGGWFRSRQRVVFASALPVAGAAAPRFTLHNDVLHGPLLGLSGIGAARVRSTVELPAGTLDEIRALFGEQPALEVTTRIGFLGGGRMVMRSSGRTLEAPEGKAQVLYETTKLRVDFDRDVSRYEIAGRLPRLEIRGRDGQLVVLDDLTLDGDAKRIAGFEYLYDSGFATKLRGMEFTGPGGHFKVSNLHYDGDMDAEEGFVDLSVRLGSGAVEAAQLKAVELDVREVHYDISMKRLHAPTLDGMYAAMQEFYRSLPAVEDAEDAAALNEAMRESFVKPLAEHAGSLLAHDPELHFDRFGLATAEGEAVLKGMVRTVGMTPQDFQTAGFAGALGKLQAEFTVEIAPALAEKIPNGATMVGAGLDNGYLVREEGKLVARVTYRDGTLTVNGKTQAVPLPGAAARGGGAAQLPPATPPAAEPDA